MNKNNSSSSQRKMNKLVYIPNDIPKLLKNGIKIFGATKVVPTQTCIEQTSQQTLKGLIGEQIVGSLLNLQTYDYRNLYVCHAVKLHDSTENGETDHIVIHNNNLILVETKTFNRYSKIKVNPKGVAYGILNETFNHATDQTDDEFDYNYGKATERVKDNQLAAKIVKYQTRFPYLKVTGILAVTNTTTEGHSEYENYHVANLTTLPALLNNILSKHSTINTDTTKQIVTYFAINCLE